LETLSPFIKLADYVLVGGPIYIEVSMYCNRLKNNGNQGIRKGKKLSLGESQSEEESNDQKG
jgi:ribosome-associated protein YbcJ (S4-like RNA binding protein)